MYVIPKHIIKESLLKRSYSGSYQLIRCGIYFKILQIFSKTLQNNNNLCYNSCNALEREGLYLKKIKQIVNIFFNFWKKVWGQNFDYTPDEIYFDERKLKPEQIWLTLRRILVLIICFLFLKFLYSINEVKVYNVRACWNKDICIIQGPDLNYYRTIQTQSRLIDGRYSLIFNGYGSTVCGSIFSPITFYQILKHFVVNGNLDFNADSKIEIYDKRKNKYLKVHNGTPPINRRGMIIKEKIIRDSKTGDLIIKGIEYRYKLNGPKYIEKYLAKFSLKRHKIEIIDNFYNKNYDFFPSNLFMTEDVGVFYPIFILGTNKYYDSMSGKIILKNGMEIKTPYKHLVEDNVFNYKLDNGNVVFVNLKGTYIFVNNKNRFILADNETTKQNKIIVEKLNNYSNKVLKANINNLRTINLPNNNFLFTYKTEGKYSKYKVDHYKRTILYNHTTKEISQGPTFRYTPNNSKVLNLEDNRWLFSGGCNNYGQYREHPHKHSQILIYKGSK